jgi:isoleucyl-tRNA synthetase
MERENLRNRALEAIKTVKWLPSSGQERMTNMVATRPDWCISRQRVWGVPILVFYCEGCAEPFTDKRVLDRVVEQFREYTADVWYEKTAEELMGPSCKCAKCGATSFRKETDILDVWFDSGSSHLAVLTPENGLPWPSDMYIEGGDQYRGWFQSSLTVGVGLKNGSPYRECLTSGWTLDADGKAMSKSANSIGPEQVLKRYGADILRLWAGSVDFMEDVRLSDVILERLSEAYRKLRNSGFRYMLGNLVDFDPVHDRISGDRLSGFEAWILVRAEELVRRCLAFYQQYEFHKVYRSIYDFVITDLSAIYFDVSKDRLYTAGPNSLSRRSAQTALHRLNLALVRLLAPILSFTCEEVWRHTKFGKAAPESVHLAYFPEPEELTEGLTADSRARAADWEKLLPVRDQVLKALDAAREEKVIGTSLEAAVSLEASGDLYNLLHTYEPGLPTWFIVSQVSLEHGSGAPGVEMDTQEVKVKVDRARGDKCERCWKYTLDVGSDPEFPTICASCASVVREFLQ